MTSCPIMKPTARLKTVDQAPCFLALTENVLVWEVCSDVLETHKRYSVELREIVFVNTVSSYRNVSSSAECSSLLRCSRHLPSDVSPGFVIGVIHHSKNNHWKLREIIFLCESEQDAHYWINELRFSIQQCVPTRPHNLLVFVNPNAGHKQAEQLYSKVVAPIFKLAGVDAKVIVTTHRGHATEYLLQNSVDAFDGVACVGGDGFLAEVVQGLLLRERVKHNLPLYDGHLPGDVEIPCPVHIGVIGAGSTDTVVFSTQGINDVLTSVIHIITGDSLALDVAAIHSARSGAFIRYVLSMTGYGFHSDILRDDDKLRWMGPCRYNWSGLGAFLRHSVYSGQISYLPSSDQTSHPMDGVLCTIGCSVCSRGLSSTLRGDAHLNTAPQIVAISADTKPPCPEGSGHCTGPEESDLKCTQLGTHSSSPQISTAPPDTTSMSPTKALPKSDPISSPSPLRSPSWMIQGCPNGWRTISGRFVAINAFLQSCRCLKAMSGPSPCAHLGNGCLDLVLIQDCSRARFLQFLFRTASNRRPFALPFVTVLRVCAFEFHSELPELHKRIPCHDTTLATAPALCSRCPSAFWSLVQCSSSASDGSHEPESKQRSDCGWCADGELVQHTNVSVFVHRQLIRLYARGPDAQGLEPG